MGDSKGGDVVTFQERYSALLGGGGCPAFPIHPLLWGGQYTDEADRITTGVMVDIFEHGEKEVSLGGGLPAGAGQGD